MRILQPIILMVAVWMTACQTPDLTAPKSTVSANSQIVSPSDKAVDNTRRLISGSYKSSAWVNDRFTGTHSRTLTDNVLIFEIEQTVEGGGWDAGLSNLIDPEQTVAEINPDLTICFSYDLDLVLGGRGKWWVGPKVSVNWAAMTDAPSEGDWYENYIVEMANQSPAELEADLFDFFEAESMGETEIDGATYRHIRLRYQDWWQYWSIRQDYRFGGTLALAPIFEAWGDIPLELPFDGVKANIETHGPVSGQGQIVSQITSASEISTNCK